MASFNNNSGGYMDNSNNNSSGGYAKKPLGEQTMRPLTVKQIQSAISPQENTFKVDNSNVTQITFVGVIRKIQELATNYVYAIEDGTGVIDVRKWVEQNETPVEADARRELLVNTYVRVYGRLNSFSNRTSVVAHSMRPIKDYNEITYHLLEAIQTHLVFAKPGSPARIGGLNNDPMQIDGPNKPLTIHDHVSQAIKEYDESDNSDKGANIQQVIKKLQGIYNESEIRDSVQHLMDGGQCYPTTDSDHWKSCL